MYIYREAILPLCLCYREVVSQKRPESRQNIFRANHIFSVQKEQKETTSVSINRGIDRLCYIHQIHFNRAIKVNEV